VEKRRSEEAEKLRKKEVFAGVKGAVFSKSAPLTFFHSKGQTGMSLKIKGKKRCKKSFIVVLY
jgi:hypothetical protein